MAQSMGLAGLLAKAQTGSRLVNALAKGKDFKTVFSELAAPNLAKAAATVYQLNCGAKNKNVLMTKAPT